MEENKEEKKEPVKQKKYFSEAHRKNSEGARDYLAKLNPKDYKLEDILRQHKWNSQDH
jgi:hypothetical protein